MLATFSLTLLLSAGLHGAQAVNVYLSPHPTLLQSVLSPEDASAALSRHLGLEAFEPIRDASKFPLQEEWFVGKGYKRALVLTADERDAQAILPDVLQPAFTLETPPSTPILSLDSVISTYLHRARHAFASLFSSFDFGKVSDMESLSSFFESSEDSAFAAIELSGLHKIGEVHGRFSAEYAQAAESLRSFLEQSLDDPNFNFAILTYPSPASVLHIKRQNPQQTQSPLPPNLPPPQQPIGSISTCFSTLDTCNNGTSSCSGRGQCVEASKSGRTCFICSCGVTTTGEGKSIKTDRWAGESCERKDISGPFVLLSGTVIVIIILLMASVSLLYGVGDQPLPSTLLATAVTAKKD